MELVNISDSKLFVGKDWTLCATTTDNWALPWLDGPFDSIVWNIKTDKERPVTIYFDDYIPATGGSLGDPEFKSLVTTIKKVLVLKRTGHLATDDASYSLTTRAESQRSLATSLKNIALFLIKKYGTELVSKSGYCLLGKAEVEEFQRDLIEGRADKAIGLTSKLHEVFSEIKDAQCLSKVLFFKEVTLPSGDSDELCLIDYSALSEISCIPATTLSNLSPVTKDAIGRWTSVKQIKSKKSRYVTEYPNACPSHITESDNNIGDTTLDALLSGIRALNELQHYLPELHSYVSPNHKISKELKDKAIKAKTRTPNIPSDVALNYLNEAIRLILVYGNNIADTKHECDKQLQELHATGSSRRDHWVKKLVIPVNDFTTDYKVTRFHELPRGCSPAETRDDVSVEFAVKMLQAATYILTGTFCIKRIDEVISLYENSCVPGLWGGFEIIFGIEKSSPTERLLLTGRPVPTVVANAFDMLSRCNELCVDVDSPDENKFLFQLKPQTDGQGKRSKNKPISGEKMRDLLCRFADFVEIPTAQNIDGMPSRWYLRRTHALRRFGAKAYYASSDLSDFPALSWLMGHRSTKETWHYLLEEVSNAEMTDEEAQAVLDAIYKSSADTSAIEKLIAKETNIEIKEHSRAALHREITKMLQNGAVIHKVKEPGTERTVFSVESVNEQ